MGESRGVVWFPYFHYTISNARSEIIILNNV